MDLYFKTEKGSLYVRAVVLIKTPAGHLLRKHKSNDYLYAAGGKIELHEDSMAAAEREIQEELGWKPGVLKLSGIIENFYENSGEKIHEINFIYQAQDLYKGELLEGFVEVKDEDLNKHNIKPAPLRKFLQTNPEFLHLIEN